MTTVKIRATGLTGQTGTVGKVFDFDGTLINSGGDSASEVAGSIGLFTFTTGEILSGRYHVVLELSSGTPAASGVLDTTLSADNMVNDLGLPSSVISQIISGVQAVSSSIQSSQSGVIAVYESATNTITLENLPDLTGYDDIIFAIKDDSDLPDASSILLVSEADGLEILNSTAQSIPNTDCVLSVVQLNPGSITILINSDIANQLPVAKKDYGAKMIKSGADTVLSTGRIRINESVIDEISP